MFRGGNKLFSEYNTAPHMALVKLTATVSTFVMKFELSQAYLRAVHLNNKF